VHPRLVRVEWHDAWFDFDVEDPSHIQEDYVVSSVGYLVAETTRVVSVAAELLPDGDGYRAVTHIQRVLIDHIVPLTEGGD
jgi:hypothetical protein